jgi:hypothetical protein
MFFSYVEVKKGEIMIALLAQVARLYFRTIWLEDQDSQLTDTME